MVNPSLSRIERRGVGAKPAFWSAEYGYPQQSGFRADEPHVAVGLPRRPASENKGMIALVAGHGLLYQGTGNREQGTGNREQGGMRNEE